MQAPHLQSQNYSSAHQQAPLYWGEGFVANKEQCGVGVRSQTNHSIRGHEILVVFIALVHEESRHSFWRLQRCPGVFPVPDRPAGGDFCRRSSSTDISEGMPPMNTFLARRDAYQQRKPEVYNREQGFRGVGGGQKEIVCLPKMEWASVPNQLT